MDINQCFSSHGPWTRTGLEIHFIY